MKTYIKINQGKIQRSIDILNKGAIVVDIDKNGNILGVEILADHQLESPILSYTATTLKNEAVCTKVGSLKECEQLVHAYQEANGNKMCKVSCERIVTDHLKLIESTRK